MRIRRLVIDDFKSFSGRTTLSLPSGVSVIVGRNGSGKSNLIDAIRWVLGEDDLVSLRVRMPADVISRGDEQRLLAGRARVTVTLGENRGRDEPDMVVSRTYDLAAGDSFQIDGTELSRSGFLEKLRARGLQVPLATVIRQGDVGRLLWLHPAERSMLLCRAIACSPADVEALEEDLLANSGSLRETEQELERLDARGADLNSRLRGKGRGEDPGDELAAARAGLLTALAPSPDDQDLRRLLEFLDLPPRSGGPSPAGADGVLARVQAERIEGLLATGAGPAAEARGLEKRLDFVEAEARRRRAELEELRAREANLRGNREALAATRQERFEELHARLQSRFAGFFDILVPGGEAGLPLVAPGTPFELPGIGVKVRFPQKPAVPLEALSGGQLSVLGLCLALAAFLEIASPALVLDEVEPALDEVLVRRLTRLLSDVGNERQILAVSHQPLMRHTAGQVMQIQRKEGRSRLGLQYDPKLLRGPASSGQTTTS